MPAVVSLVLLHGVFGGLVPLAARSAGEIVLLDEGLLNFRGALRSYAALAAGRMLFGMVLGAAAVAGVVRGGGPVRADGEGGRGGQCGCKEKRLPCSEREHRKNLLGESSHKTAIKPKATENWAGLQLRNTGPP